VFQPVLDTLKTLHEQGVWLEITNLVVPTYTDDEDMIRKMCKWIVDNLGTDYPLHFSRFHPQYKLKHLAMTSIEFLRKAKKIAEDAGIRHVYIGNIAEAQETVCPDSDRVCIRRTGYKISKNVVDKQGKCDGCSEKIAGRWG
jgi:pyruvate formate lyase activating enzyme